MSIRGGTRTARRARHEPVVPTQPAGRPNGYQRTGRYGRGPGDQRRYERYGDSGGGLGGLAQVPPVPRRAGGLVLVALFTVARPLARLAVVAVRRGQPGAPCGSGSSRTSSARTWARR